MLKIGWVVQKWIFSFCTAMNSSKCILMVSLYTLLSIYTNNEILCIIWIFDLSSRGVLGKIYALSIEVLTLNCLNLHSLCQKSAYRHDFNGYFYEFPQIFVSTSKECTFHQKFGFIMSNTWFQTSFHNSLENGYSAKTSLKWICVWNVNFFTMVRHSKRL